MTAIQVCVCLHVHVCVHERKWEREREREREHKLKRDKERVREQKVKNGHCRMPVDAWCENIPWVPTDDFPSQLFSNADGPWLFDLKFSPLWWCESDRHSVESILGILILFWVSLWGTILSGVSGQGSLSSQAGHWELITRVSNWHAHNHSTPTELLCFVTFSTVFKPLNETPKTSL